MLTVVVPKRVHPARLHEALAAAGLRVVTVRGLGQRAEVVLDDGQDEAAVAALVAAHDADADPERTRIEAALAVLEDQTRTDKARLTVACEVLARLLRDRLR